MLTLASLLGGLALLVAGAEALVRSASAIAVRLHVPALVVGLTIVAFGTSAPELAVSTMAARDGQSALALGNVVGSNIYNVLAILGASALIAPLVISQQLVRLDVPIMIGVSCLTFVMALDGTIGRLEGVVLIAGIVAYTVLQVVLGRRTANGQPAPPVRGSTLRHALFIVAGLALLVGGSRLFLDGAVEVALAVGVSELVIGLTVVAAGTSLPETATSIVAVLRGERDIAIGNVVGSNIFNLLGVLGVAGVLAPAGIEVTSASLQVDLPVMIAAALACLPLFFVANTIARWQGAVFVGYYVAYVTWLILDAKGHDAIGMFGTALLYLVVPITVIAFGATAVRRWRLRATRG